MSGKLCHCVRALCEHVYQQGAFGGNPKQAEELRLWVIYYVESGLFQLSQEQLTVICFFSSDTLSFKIVSYSQKNLQVVFYYEQLLLLMI